MPFPFLLVIAAAILIGISVLLRPKIKASKPDAATDLENPVSEAGKPIPVPFGTITVKGLNCLWFGDKHIRTHKVKS